MAKATRTIKGLFQHWLFLLVTAAFALTFLVSYVVQGRQAEASAHQLLLAKMDEAELRVIHTRSHLAVVQRLSRSLLLTKAKAVAQAIAREPDRLLTAEGLRELLNEFELHEINVADGDAIVRFSNFPAIVGRDWKTLDTTRDFLGALTDRRFALVQDVRPSNEDGKLYQYAAVARLDCPGIVEVGVRAKDEEEAQWMASMAAVGQLFSVGHHGALRIYRYHAEAGRSRQRGDRFFHDLVDGRWSLCLVRNLPDLSLVINLPVEEMHAARRREGWLLVIADVVLFAVVFALVSRLLQGVVINGIDRVNVSLARIADGQLDEQVRERSTREFTSLSDGVNAMVGALKGAIAAEARRVDAELETARTIQRSVLPDDFSLALPSELFAVMVPAREVGGDFYDVFALPGGRLALVMADVSGKGITAALFMMNGKALLKQQLVGGRPVAEAIAAVNAALCVRNESRMFMTAFVAVLDPRDGSLECVNAGHNPPLVRRAGGAWEWLRIRHSIALGVTDRARYQAVPVPFGHGARLLLYTDGVTEAQNGAGQLFGEQRLKDFLDAADGTPQQHLEALLAELARHADGTPQSDDITILEIVCHAPCGDDGSAGVPHPTQPTI